MITGQPKLFLRLEGLALLAASLVAFTYLKQSFWIFAALFLVPDLCLAFYFIGPRRGAVVYNICHSTIGPWLLAIYGVLAGEFSTSAASIGLRTSSSTGQSVWPSTPRFRGNPSRAHWKVGK